jgi:hypothetical protein
MKQSNITIDILEKRNAEIQALLDHIEKRISPTSFGKHRLSSSSLPRTPSKTAVTTTTPVPSSTIPQVRRRLWQFTSPLLGLSEDQLEQRTRSHPPAKTIEIWRPFVDSLFPGALMCKNLVVWGKEEERKCVFSNYSSHVPSIN